MNVDSKLYRELNDVDISKVLRNSLGEDIKFTKELMLGGLFYTTYHIGLLNRNDVILRVGPINEQLLLDFEHNLMESENIFYNMCKKRGIPCSNVIEYDVKNKLISRNYMIVDYIESKPLSELKVSEDIEEKIFKEIGVYTRTLHSIEGKSFGRVYDVAKGDGFELWSDYLSEEFSKVGESLIKHSIFTEKEIGIFKSLIIQYKDLLDEIKVANLIHGDLWTGNILIKQDYSVGAIIDGDRSIYGDRDFEFANEWMTNKAFMKGYGTFLNTDVRSIKRRKIYCIMYSLIDTYVWAVEYNNEQLAIENKNRALRLLSELL